MPSNNQIDAKIREAMPRAANVLATSMRAKAPTKRIKGAIAVREVVSPQAGTYQIDVAIPLKDAPEAGAYEWGSGIHHPTKPGTYVIRPKTKKVLAFFWDKVDESSPTGPKFRGISPTTGKAIFTYVDHPGVAKRPYIRPSIEEKKPEIRQILGRAFAIGIRSALGELLEDVK